jgi:hypothetical protein
VITYMTNVKLGVLLSGIGYANASAMLNMS